MGGTACQTVVGLKGWYYLKLRTEREEVKESWATEMFESLQAVHDVPNETLLSNSIKEEVIAIADIHWKRPMNQKEDTWSFYLGEDREMKWNAELEDFFNFRVSDIGNDKSNFCVDTLFLEYLENEYRDT